MSLTVKPFWWAQQILYLAPYTQIIILILLAFSRCIIFHLVFIYMAWYGKKYFLANFLAKTAY
jgi:hypothetical protein